MRTPLNAILGNTELLLDGSSGPLSAQARACLGEVQSAGRRLLRQVQLLLACSELSDGNPAPAESRVDLLALIREALTGQRVDTVRVTPPDAQLWMWGDRSRLQRLVAEILALDSVGSATPELRVETADDRSLLCFAWPEFCAAQLSALQMALIETIARSQGAELALRPDGLSLLWAGRQPERPGATPATDAAN